MRFAPGRVTGILEKGEQLIRYSLTQKRHCLRNCSGKLAHAGYTPGAKNAGMVGWARQYLSNGSQIKRSTMNNYHHSSVYSLHYYEAAFHG